MTRPVEGRLRLLEPHAEGVAAAPRQNRHSRGPLRDGGGTATVDGRSAALRVRGLSRRFGETVALSGANLTIRAGEVCLARAQWCG
jgi:hypothetical protein